MSDIQFNCPECGHSLAVDSAGAGMLVQCPECQKQITIPAAPQDKLGVRTPAPMASIPSRSREPFMRMVIATIGCIFVSVGIFLPCFRIKFPDRVASAPAIMSVSNLGVGTTLTFLALSIISFLIAYRSRFRWLWLTGAIILAIMMQLLSQITSETVSEWFGTENNELILSVLYGGYVVLLGGVLIVLSATRILTKPRQG